MAIMIVRIRNETGASGVWRGTTIADGDYYSFSSTSEYESWLSEKMVGDDLANGRLVLNDGVRDVASFSDLRPSSIEIVEEHTPPGMQPTGGHYQAKCLHVVVDSAVTQQSFSFPFPISIFSCSWINGDLFEGDEICVLVGEDTPIGVLTANVPIGASILPVSDAVINAVCIGYNLKLSDGVNQDDLGLVIDIDTKNNLVTMTTPTSNSYVAENGATKCLQTIEFIPHMTLQSVGRTELAKDVVGGSYLPANVPINIKYKNVEGTTAGKVFRFILEYKY